MNNFVLTYGTYSPIPTQTQLLNHVQTSRYIVQYYQPYAGTFFLKSAFGLYEINQSIIGLFDGTQYTLVQFDPSQIAGTLPQEIWTWINHGILPPIPAPPPKPKGLGLGLGALLGETRKD